MKVLNIPVPEALLQRWREWLAPEQHVFFFTQEQADALNLVTSPRSELSLSDAERDTLTLWRVPKNVDRVAYFTPAEWADLTPAMRQEVLRLQVRHGRGNMPLGRHYADLIPELPARRFLWQPEHLTPEVLARVVSREQKASGHDRVPENVWKGAALTLPGARALAGTFSNGVGNCFGTVMGAAGVLGAENEWKGREPFENFLSEKAAPGGRNDQPGTLLVWRGSDGLVQHAAVTLGGGWALEKPAQTWWTPRVVLPVRELIRGNRTPGQTLRRYRLR